MSHGISIIFYNDFIKFKMYINQRKHRQMKYKHRSINQIAGMFTRSGWSKGPRGNIWFSQPNRLLSVS